MKFLRYALGLVLSSLALLQLHADIPEIFVVTPTGFTNSENVYIIGTDFVGTNGLSVFFGDSSHPGKILRAEDTYIQVVVPTNAPPTGKIIVQSVNGTSLPSGQRFYVIPTVDFATRWIPSVPTNGMDLSLALPDETFQLAPGNEVRITGHGFTSPDGTDLGTTVYFGDIAVPTTNITATEIHFIVPTNAVTGAIGVGNFGGSEVIGTNFYIVPTISSFTPSAEVGGVVTLTGTSFLGVTNIAFGNVSTHNFVVANTAHTQIQVAVPPYAPTTSLISVTSGGRTYTNNAMFALVPSATDATPRAGVAGDTILITGYGLETVTNVAFRGGVAAVPAGQTYTNLSVTLPQGAVTGPLTFNSANGSSATRGYIYLPPVITGFSPQNGVVGDKIRVTGSSLLGVDRIKLGGVSVSDFTIEGTNGTSILVTIPPGIPPSSDITVSNPGANGFTTTAPGTFSLLPTISGLTVQEEFFGTQVTVTGFGFTGTTNVSFGGIAQPVIFSTDTTLTIALTTNGLGAGVVINTQNGAATNAALVYNPPVITGFSPDHAKLGDSFTVTGTNLFGSTNVMIGDFSLSSTNFSPSGTNIVLTIRDGTPTSGSISITRNGNTFTTSSNFRLAPSISGVLPRSYSSVGQGITFVGYGLEGVTNVVFGAGSSAVPLGSDLRSVTVTVPSGALTGPIRVSTPVDTYVFTNIFGVGPEIVSFTPNHGTSGTIITLTGFNFTNATIVNFINALTNTLTTNFVVQTDTAMQVTVPSGAKSGQIAVGTSFGNFTTTDSFYIGPVVTSFLPAIGPVGSKVTFFGHNLSEVTKVLFNGTASTNITVLTDNRIVVTVPPGASTGPVRLINPEGSYRPEAQFQLQPIADLGVSMTVDKTNLTAGSSLTVTFSLSNSGPDHATDVVAHFTSSGAATVTSTSSSPGTSNTGAYSADFMVGDLASGGSATGTITLNVATNSPLSLVLAVSTSSFDPNATNDSANVELQALSASLAIAVGTNNVFHLTWPLTDSGFVLEQTSLLVPSVWSSVTNAPGTDSANGLNFVDLSSTNSGSFFRLRK